MESGARRVVKKEARELRLHVGSEAALVIHRVDGEGACGIQVNPGSRARRKQRKRIGHRVPLQALKYSNGTLPSQEKIPAATQRFPVLPSVEVHDMDSQSDSKPPQPSNRKRKRVPDCSAPGPPSKRLKQEEERDTGEQPTATNAPQTTPSPPSEQSPSEQPSPRTADALPLEAAAERVTLAFSDVLARLKEFDSLFSPTSDLSVLSSPPSELDLDSSAQALSTRATTISPQALPPPSPPPSPSTSPSSPPSEPDYHPSPSPPPSRLKTPRRKSTRLTTPKASPYFPPPNPTSKPKTPRPPPTSICTQPFPPTTNRYFPLLQHHHSHSPFQLLITCYFLNRTKGCHARPALEALLAAYPTPESLAAADHEAVLGIVRSLGLQNRRAAMLVRLAREFVARPPVRGRRYVVRGYPGKGDGRGLPKDAVLGDEDDEATQGGGFEERLGVRRGGGGAWEIGHLPTAGAYSLDSFRMFARDILRGIAEGYDGEGAETIPRAETMTTTVAGIRGGRVDVETPAFEPEWKRVIPLDKELRAWLRWRWLKEGRVYDVRTGRTWEAGEDLVRRGREGGLRWGEIDEVAVGLAAAETAAAEDSGSCGAAGGEGTEGTKGDGEG